MLLFVQNLVYGPIRIKYFFWIQSMTKKKPPHSQKQLLKSAMQEENSKFEYFFDWLEKNMSPNFFENFPHDNVSLIVHSLMGFHLQEYFSQIRLKNSAIVLCIDSPDADLSVLRKYHSYGIKTYQTFISKDPLPLSGTKGNLRIALIQFTEAFPPPEKHPASFLKKLFKLAKKKNPDLRLEDFESLMGNISPQFLKVLSVNRMAIALEMYFRAQTRDHCQYISWVDKKWEETDAPSMRIVLAWRNAPKHGFLFRLATMIHRYGLVMKRVNASYIDPYEKHNILIMSIGLHGIDGKAVWDVCDHNEFLRELVLLKFFPSLGSLGKTFIESGLLRGNLGFFLKAAINFIHQVLVHVDSHQYAFQKVKHAICRHPSLTVQLCQLFELRFHPEKHNQKKFQTSKRSFLKELRSLDTGHEDHDLFHKNVLLQALNFVEHTLRTNFYRNNKTAISFRLDPKYLENVPFDRSSLFPEIPYAIYFIKGMHYFGFHVRFKDLSRGGLRTVFPRSNEQMEIESKGVFLECYNLAYTQHKKNKDIPEGGAKGVIFLKPYRRLHEEMQTLEKELRVSCVSEEDIKNKLYTFEQEQISEYLYHTQRTFIDAFLTILNCTPTGKMIAKHIVNYWKRPEYIYLGPDENMHNPMIDWIASQSVKYNYKPGKSFISAKPDLGINHKEYGVTSLGVNVYMHEILKHLKINPLKDKFTIKITGGPDGDVAGNQIYNLYRYYRNTAKLLALTDVSGTIYDPAGLCLEEMKRLFHSGLSISYYNPELLSSEGFLLDCQTKQEETEYSQQTLLWKKEGSKAIQTWVSGNEMNNIYRNTVHEVATDIFVPAGGRPRTLNNTNFRDFLTDRGAPSSKAIVEGANLYLTPWARLSLEKMGVLIIKDSSANKAGVICSSFEVLSGLVLNDKEFIKHKSELVSQVLEILKKLAYAEAKLLLSTYNKGGRFLTEISNLISDRINLFTDQLLSHFESIKLSSDPKDPLIRCYLDYCPPILRDKFQERLIHQIPDIHKKAIIASKVASTLVYSRGVDWSPSIVDILPILWKDKRIFQELESFSFDS